MKSILVRFARGSMQTVMAVVGTRPEVIKMAPVVHAARARPDIKMYVLATGQHREMLEQALHFFDISADENLDLMHPDQSPADLAGRTLSAMQQRIGAVRPDWIVVQGDTTTAMAGALAGFYNRTRVAHVEAGLRTSDRFSPFPEEVNRRIISMVAGLHFAPTEAAKATLLNEGHGAGDIVVTGNTGIDSLLWTIQKARARQIVLPQALERALAGKRLVLVTAHRRESFERGLLEIGLALRDLEAAFPDIIILLPVHANPRVREPLNSVLQGAERVLLVEPIAYGEFVVLLDRASLILTDSGGIQEEATAIGKPMLVMRDVTERPEAVAAGALLVGPHRARIVAAASSLLADNTRLTTISRPSTIFGDGRAGERIAAALAEA